MNEKALQQLYVLAQGDGYSKSFDDFKQLLSENKNAINQMYGLAQNDGYTKDVEQFKTLVGFGGAVGGDAMVSEAVEQVKKKDEPESLVSEEFALPNTPESFVPSPESDSLSEDGTPIEVEKNPYDGTLLDEQPANFFDESLAGVNADLIDYEEQYVVPKLNYQFNDYGFTFAQTGIGDGMKVKAANGNEHYTNLDPFWGEKGEAEALQKFLKENRAENQVIIDQSTAIIENKRKIDNEEQIINTVKAFNEESEKFESNLKEYALYKNKLDNLYKKNFSNVTKEQLNSDPVLKANFEQWVSAKEASNKVLEDLKKQNQDFERKGVKIDQMAGEYYEMASEQGGPGGAFVNALLDGSARFGTTAMNVMTDAATYFTPNRGMGERDYKSEIARVALENGSFEEGKFRETYPESKIKNGMVEVLDPELGTPKMIPIETFPSVYDLSKEDLIKELGGDTNDSKFLGQTLLQTALALRLGKAAYSIPIVEETEFDKANAKVMDLVRKGIKEFESYDQAVEGRYRNPFSSTAQGTDVTLGMLDAGRRGMREVLGSDNTTKQWSDTAKEGFWGGALLGLTESLPAMIGGSSPAGWAQRTAQMYAQVTDHVYEEMEENAAFDNVTESEKSMVAVPIGVAVGTLEAIGLRNVIGQKGLLNGVVSRALRKSTKNTTAKSFGEFIRQDVESMIGRGLLTVGAGGLAEYETGALQEAAELTIKDIYNDVKGKDMFRTPETWKDWITQVNRAGMQEAIGGFILGTPGGVANAVSGLQVQKLDNRIYEMFEFMTKDENYTKMYVTKLKQKIADSNDPKTKKEAQEELALVKRLQGILPRIPSDYNTNQKKEALQLIFQKESLESQIKSEDDVLSKPKQDLLNKVNDRLAGIVNEASVSQQESKENEQNIPDLNTGNIVDESETEQPGDVTVEEQTDIDNFFNEDNSSSETKAQNLAINRSENVGEQNQNPFRNSVVKIAEMGAKAISKILPNLKIVMHETNDQYLKYAKLGDGRAEYNPDNTTIHINLSKATKTTVPHEIFHAVLMEKVKNDPAIARAAEQMMLSVQKLVPKDSDLGKRIEAFAAGYKGNEFQNEERLAELVGILSSEYRQLDRPSKNIVIEFLKGIAKKFGIEIGNDFGAKDADVIDLLNVISRKTRTGEVITEADVKTLERSVSKKTKTTDTKSKPKVRQQKSIEEIARYYNMNTSGFLPNQVDLYRLKKDLPPGIGVKQSRVDQYGRGGSYYLTNSRGYKINPYKNKGRQQKDIESYIVEARRNNFRDDVIKDFLVRVKKFPAKLVNQLMALDVDLFDQMPKSFGNVKGGAQVGLALYKKVDAYRKKLQKSNNKRKNKLSEQEILDKTIEFLEQQKEYIAEADAKTKGISTQQAQMLSDLQNSLGIRPSQNLGQKIAQARLFLRQRRKGAKDLQKIKTEVRNFIRKSLPKELYSKGEVIKLIDKVNKATEKNIENILQEVTDFVIETNIKSLQKKVDGVLNGKYQAVENGRLKSKKIVDEVRKRIDKIKSNLVGPKATAEQIGEVNMKLLDRFNELAQEPQQTVEQREEMVDLQLAMQYNNAMLMENSNPNKVTELDGIYSTLEEMITFGRSLLQEELLRQHQYYNEQFEQGYEAITGDKVDMSDPDAKSQLNNRKKQRASDLKRKKATQNVVRTFFSNMFTKIGNYTFGSAEAMDGLMDRIDKLPGKMFGGRLNEMFTDRIDESSRRFKMRMMEVESIIAGYLYEAYGKKWKKVSRENRIQKDLGIELHDGIMLEPISQDQIAYLYNMYKDPANRASFSNPKMWGVEVINREDSASEKKRKQKENEANAARVMKELETQLDPKVKEVADWQVEVLYPALYEEYNKTYKKLYRTDLPWNKFYAGTIYRDGVPESEIDVINLLGQGNMYKTAVGAGATKVRQNSSLPIQAMNMMDVLNTYINDMEYFAAYGEAIRDMDKFFSNEYVKGAIGDIHGNEIYTFVKDMIQKVASQGQQTGIRAKIINGMNNVFLLSRLALSPVITIKQLTSTFTYSNDIGPLNWLKYAAKNKTQQLKVWKEVTENSVYMKDRNNQSIMRAIETYTDAKMKEFVPRPTKDFLINFMMYTTKIGDRGAIMLGGLPNYSYYKANAIKDGKTEEEAIQIAIRKFERDTKRTQQSADLQDKDYLQTGDPITRAMNMFLTTPKQYLRKEIIATRNLYRAMSGQAYKGTVAQNVRTFLMYHVFMPVLFQYVSMGLPGILRGFRDDDEEDLLRAGVIGNLNALFIIGEVVQTAADAFTDKPWAGSQAKTVGLIQIANGIARDFMKAGKYKDEEKKAKAYRDAYLELSTLTGLPMPTIAKFFDNYSKMGDEADLDKMIMRLLNYSNYQIEGPNKKGSGKSEGTMDDFYKKIQKEKEKKAREDKKKAAGFNSSGGFNNAGFKNNSFDSKGFEGGFD